MFNRGSAAARKVAYQFFYKHGYSQAFVLNDLPINPSLVVKELNDSNIPFQIKHSSLGPLIIVKNGI
jgi:hypothetical protein